MTREERKGRRGRVANSCVSVVCVLVGACTVSLDLWWQVSSVISVLKLDVFDFWNVKPEHTTFLWGTWGETTEVNWPSNLSEFKSKRTFESKRKAWESKCGDGGGDGWRDGRPKREIVTTELVAGADFFHHLPCAAGRQQLEDWERVRVKPRPQHPTTKHNASTIVSTWSSHWTTLWGWVAQQHLNTDQYLSHSTLGWKPWRVTLDGDVKNSCAVFWCVFCILHCEKGWPQMIFIHTNNWVKMLYL